MIVDLTTGDETEPELKVKQRAGCLGGPNGEKARNLKLLVERKSEIAWKSANKCWSKSD